MVNNSYGKKVVTGEYKVLVNLSNGYELLDNLQPFKVLFGKNNVFVTFQLFLS